MENERVEARPSQRLGGLNLEMEAELNDSRLDGESECGGGMVQLFDPKGQANIICRLGFAERWCSGKSDWRFEELS